MPYPAVTADEQGRIWALSGSVSSSGTVRLPAMERPSLRFLTPEWTPIVLGRLKSKEWRALFPRGADHSRAPRRLDRCIADGSKKTAPGRSG